MTSGGHLTTAWPRLVAHFAVLLTVGALWALPHAHVPGVGSRLRVAPSVAGDATFAPLQEMASRARVTTALPDAGGTFFLAAPPSKSAARATPTKARRTPATTKKAGATKTAPAVFAQGAADRAGWGNDISWPQCGGSVPGQHDVGVIGVTGGRPFTTNPCLADQYGWSRASQMAGGAQVYINLEIGGTTTGPHGCGPDDHLCRAYDYGWQSVTDAMGRASGQGVSSTFWWLDVEVGNNWSSDHLDWNSRAVQGAIDAVHSRNLDVGIYSSVDQWAQILPDAFKPGVPTWLAVVGDQQVAPGLCSRRNSLTGGPVYMVQYDDHVFDWDHVCAAGSAGFAAAAARQGH